jgi:hypothetical protein
MLQRLTGRCQARGAKAAERVKTLRAEGAGAWIPRVIRIRVLERVEENKTLGESVPRLRVGDGDEWVYALQRRAKVHGGRLVVSLGARAAAEDRKAPRRKNAKGRR